MRTCFEIAIYTGCRVSDTNMPLRDIDLEAKTITLEKPKGGAERAFTVPMREELVPPLYAIETGTNRRTDRL